MDPPPAAPAAPRRPPHPYLVLGVAIVLPGVGQLLNDQTHRALMLLFFMVMGGWVTYHLSTPEHSFVGRLAGGFFIYAIAVLDAYKWARVRWTVFHHPRPAADAQSG